ncbi:uncharacterized protein P884DRAFT_206941 [Thermothelomyces heterothallicus CBS 202.75]|uniref:uncharacterized protein n=1 Tax=Thermothelomyces heterothallicus CBS 202.75 TaxID=1149848 RepID=UPI0037448585
MDPGWSEWSEWVWDDGQKRWWKARQNIQGDVEYDFFTPHGNVDELVSSFKDMDFGAHQDTHYPQGSAYAYGTLNGAEGAAVAETVYNQAPMPTHSASRARGKAKPADPHGKPKGKDREKGAGKNNRPRPARDAGNENTENARPNPAPSPSTHDEAYSTTSPPSSGAEPLFDQPETTEEAASSSPGQYVHGRHDSGFETETVPRSAATIDLTAEEDDYNHMSMAHSSNEPDNSNEQLFHTAMSEVNPYLTGDVDSFYTRGGLPSAWAAQINLHDVSGRDNDRDPSNRPTQQPAGTTVPQGYQYQDSAVDGDGNYEEREPNIHGGFVVERSSRFQPGENGMPFYQGYRRFIVVANDEGHCTCVPILTYERQGCLKRGVKPSKHGIVYQTGTKPRMLPGEPQLGFSPVRVRLYEKTEKLVKESRVNYAKLTTIEHNFRVFFIGSVEQDDFQNIVIPAVDTCWERKRRR